MDLKELRYIEDISFTKEQITILGTHLLVDGSSWAIDVAHTKLHGKLMTVDYRDIDHPTITVGDTYSSFDRSPHQYFMLRYSRLHEDEQRRIFIAKVIPIETASPRQLTQFSTCRYALALLLHKQQQLKEPNPQPMPPQSPLAAAND